MIHWHTVNVPVFIPTSGFVLCWLLIGLATLLFLALEPESGYRFMIPRSSTVFGLLGTLFMLMAWPFVWSVKVRECLRENRRRRIHSRIEEITSSAERCIASIETELRP